MHELTTDPFYGVIKNYDRCVIDYCLIETDTQHRGYRSHKDAILFAMCKVIERNIAYQLQAEIECGSVDEEPFPWSLDIGKAKAKLTDSEAFFKVPEATGEASVGKMQHLPARTLSYWEAFSNPPHGTGYRPADFQRVNACLFPNGVASLEVYDWSTDWSTYFEDGNEWWGAACWSIYDKSQNRYVVILASETD